MSVGQLIRDNRNRLDFTMPELARLVGVDERTLRRWEKDEHMPSAEVLKSLCYELNLNMIDFMIAAGYIDDIDFNIIKTKNGRPTVIEYDGHRYILQHPNHYGRS